GRAHQRNPIGQQNNRKQAPLTAQETVAFSHFFPERRFVVALQFDRGENHNKQGYDDGEKTHGVDKQTAGYADHADKHAAERRPGDLGQVGHGGIERDGVHEIAARHQTIDQRVARGLIDGVHGAQKKHQDDDMPELNAVEINQRPENKRLEHRENLRRHEQPAALDTVDDGAAD